MTESLAPTNAEELLPLVYEELRKLAVSKMVRESAGDTLQPTALVHEAWLRLTGSRDPKFQNRAHFFAAAAEAMRRILIERARRKQCRRHGGGQQRLDVADLDVPIASEEDEQLLAMNDALLKLAQINALEAEVVKLRYFIGMTNDEAADALGLSPRTVKYYWAHARAWLFHEISANQ